jgi:hypothetical protein
MSKSTHTPIVLQNALSRVLNREFDTQNNDWSNQCKAALEKILETPDLLLKFANVLETIERSGKSDDPLSALPADLTLKELPATANSDAISKGWPIGSSSEDPMIVPELHAANPFPILPRDLQSSSPSWLQKLLRANAGHVLAVDLRLPAALATAGDGRELPAVSIGERDSIKVNIGASKITIDPERMTSTNPLWLTLAVIRDETLQVVGKWQFEQTVEVYPWTNTFESGVLVVSTRPVIGE